MCCFRYKFSALHDEFIVGKKPNATKHCLRQGLESDSAIYGLRRIRPRNRTTLVVIVKVSK